MNPPLFARLEPRWGWAALAALFLFCCVVIGKGLTLAWLHPGGDMYERLSEWKTFASGYYPHPRVAPAGIENVRSSVYPPYVFPAFGLFFSPFGEIQGRIVIHVLGLASFALIGAAGWRLLRPYGSQSGALGGLAAAAVASNSNTLAQGQFSILCMGLIAAQILALRNERPLTAGLCWAAAMIKPQIALPFALLFLTRRHAHGLALAIAVLGALTLFTFQSTGASLAAVLEIWTVEPAVKFIASGNKTWPGVFQALFGMQLRVAQVLIAAAVGMLSLAGVLRLLKVQDDARLLHASALCAAAAAISFYHSAVDNILLTPVLLWAFAEAFKANNRFWTAAGTLIAISVWTPQRLLVAIPYAGYAQLAIWTTAWCLLTHSALARSGAAKTKAAA